MCAQGSWFPCPFGEGSNLLLFHVPVFFFFPPLGRVPLIGSYQSSSPGNKAQWSPHLLTPGSDPGWETMSTLSRALNLQSPPRGHRALRNRPKGRSTTGPRALEKSQTLVARVSFLEVSRNRSPRGAVKPYESVSLVLGQVKAS